MKKNSKFSPEVRERAVRMVFEQRGEHESQWAAIVSIASKIGCTGETLRTATSLRSTGCPSRGSSSGSIGTGT